MVSYEVSGVSQVRLDRTYLYPAIGITLPMSLGDLVNIYVLML